MARSNKEKEPRHVRLYHWLMATEAWRDVDPVARCAYVEIASRYAGPGSNNGRIPCGVRDIASALNVGKSTAQRALTALEQHGFIVCTSKGGFRQFNRQASEWLLTEFKDDRPGATAIASKDFSRWRPNSKPSPTSGTRRIVSPGVV